LNSNHGFHDLTCLLVVFGSVASAFFVLSSAAFDLSKLSNTLAFIILYLGVVLLGLFLKCSPLGVVGSYLSHGLSVADLHHKKSFQVYLKVNTYSAA
jgi:hypothetical protein